MKNVRKVKIRGNNQYIYIFCKKATTFHFKEKSCHRGTEQILIKLKNLKSHKKKKNNMNNVCQVCVIKVIVEQIQRKDLQKL